MNNDAKGLTFLTLSLLFLWLVFDDFVGKKRLSKLAQMMTPDLSMPDPIRDKVDKVIDDTKENVKKDTQDIKKDTKNAVKDTKKSFDDLLTGKEIKKDWYDFTDWWDKLGVDKVKKDAAKDVENVWDEIGKAVNDTKKSAGDMWDDVTSSVKGWFK